MKNIYYYVILIIALFITSCEIETIDKSILNRSIKVNAHIGNSNSQAYNSNWYENDMIGIYMLKTGSTISDANAIYKNSKYTTTGDGKFKPANDENDIMFPEDGSKVDFISYYPYKTNISSSFEYPIDVSQQESPEKIDLLYSDNVYELDRKNSNINMQFNHQLSKIVVNIKMSNNSELKNARASIKGLNMKGKFSLKDKSITSSSKGSIRMKSNSKGNIAEAIVIPTDNLSGATIEVVNDKFVYIYMLDFSTIIESFESNYVYTYNMTLDPESSNVKVVIDPSSSINPWTDGPSEDITLGKDHEEEDDNNTNTGSGEEKSPYSISEARNNSGEKNKWVKGYIVGHYTGTTVKSFSNDMSDDITIKETCFALASSPNETNGENTFPVFLKTGELRDDLNLNYNRDLIGKQISIKGHIDKYYGSIGLKETSSYKWID